MIVYLTTSAFHHLKLNYLVVDGWEWFSSLQFSHSVMSDSFQTHELQHARPPCPSPTSGVHQNPCPLSRWCHPPISSSINHLCHPFLLLPSIFPRIRVLTSKNRTLLLKKTFNVCSFKVIWLLPILNIDHDHSF